MTTKEVCRNQRVGFQFGVVFMFLCKAKLVGTIMGTSKTLMMTRKKPRAQMVGTVESHSLRDCDMQKHRFIQWVLLTSLGKTSPAPSSWPWCEDRVNSCDVKLGNEFCWFYLQCQLPEVI